MWHIKMNWGEFIVLWRQIFPILKITASHSKECPEKQLPA
jgi:hypothetical protein